MKISLRSINTSKGSSLSSLTEKTSASIFCVPARHFKNLFLFFSFLLLGFWANAGTITSTAGGGNWNTTGTWVGGVVPISTDNVIINGPVTVNNGSTLTCFDLLINDGKTFTLSNKDFTVNGTVTIQGNGNIANPSSKAFIYGTTKILVYLGITAKTVGVEWPLASGPTSVIINNSSASGVTLSQASTTTNLSIGTAVSAIFNDGGFQLTATGTFTFTSGTFNIGTTSVATAWPGFTSLNTTISTGAKVNYNSLASQIIAAVNYYDLSNTGNGPRTLPGTGTVGIAGSFSPGSGAYTVTTGSTVSFNGIAAQTIPAVGFSFYNLSIDNTGAGVTISNNIIASNSLALNNGVLTTTASFKVIAANSVSRTNGWVNGTLQRHIASAAASYTFNVGDATNYSPVLINYATTSFVAGDLAITPAALQHPALATSGISTTKYVKRYWTLAGSGGLSGTYDATFNFVAGDIQGGASTSSFVVRDYSSSAWSTTTTGALTGGSTQALGLTGFGDFCVGESTGAPTVNLPQPASVAVCNGSNTSFTSTASSTPVATVFWQRSTNGTIWSNIIAGTDGGIYSNFATTTLIVTGATAAVTGYFYRAVFTNINGSVNSSSAQLTVTQLPTITSLFYSPSTMATIIATQQAVTLTGTNAYTGGTFTASPAGLSINSSTGAITPNTSSLGAYTVTYTIAAAGGCGLVSATTPVSITTASISYTGAPYCSSDNTSHTVTYNNTSAVAGATFSASPLGLSIIATTGDILPGTSTPNAYTVTYSKSNPGGFTLTTTVTITALPTATIGYTGAPFCNSDVTAKTVTLTGTGSYSGGVFSSDPLLVLNTVTGSFTPNGSSVGSHTITYTIPAAGGCASIPVTTTFSIVAAPTATVTYAGSPYCLAYTTATPTVTGASGGTFSSTAGLTFTNTSTGEINPNGSTPGTYTVTYTIPPSGSCGTVQIQTTVTIAANPAGTISYPAQPYCTADGPKTVNLTGTGNYTGGVFSSTAGLTINGTTGTVTPSSTTPNTYTVSYAPPGCPVSPFTTLVEVDAAPSATISYGGTTSFCIADGSPHTVTITGDNTGTFSSTPGGLGIDPATGTITPSTTTSAGLYNVVYTIAKTGNCGPVVVTLPITVTAIVGTPSISVSGGTEPACQLTNGTTTTTYTATAAGNTGLTWSLSNFSAGSISAGGIMTWANGFSGTVNIQVSASGCGGPSSNFRAVTISPSVTAPVFTLGATSTRCQGVGVVSYIATTTNATTLSYALDATSSGAGNTVNSGTGDVTFVAGWSGTSVITATATGCNGPLSAAHTVTVTPTVGTPVFSLGATSIRCQGAGTVTYTATATNSTGVTYSLDATTAAFVGNSIVSTTGAVTYAAGWSGTSTITASAAGCNTSPTTNHTVTVTPTVTINPFSPATSSRCQGAVTVTTTTTAANSTGITYSLDATTAGFAGNSIVASTGAVTYAAGWSGTTTITASAAGCNGPVTTTLLVTNNAITVGGSITPTLIPVCSGGSTGTMTLSGNTGAVIRWEQSTNAGSTWTTIANTLTTYSTTVTQPTLFRAIVQNGVGICALANSAAAQVIIDAPFTPIITASTNPVCIGGSITLTASSYTSTGLVVSGGDFATANPPGWNGASANNSNGDPNSGWGEANGGKAWNGVTYNSTGKFMIINGTGTPGNTSLTSPVFSLVGLSSAYLAFNQAYNLTTGALAQIQISMDGGGSYTTLQTYTGLVSAPGSIFGNPSNFGADPKVFINLNAYLGMTNLMLKFLYTPQAGSNWALDNIVVTNNTSNPGGTGVYNSVIYAWAPAANLSSTTGQAVTFNSVTSGAGSFPYTVTTTTSAAGCVSATPGTVTVIVSPATVAGTLPSISDCTNGATGSLTLSGNTGGVVRWESSLDNFATAGTIIANTTTSLTYTVAATTIYYRAYVQSGTCTAAYSTIATVGLHNVWTGVTSTNWNTGSNWSDGLVPSISCPNVTITNVANKPVLSSGTATINNLIINSGASLTVTGATLQIAGSITNSGGIFDVSNGSLDFNGIAPQTIAANLFVGNNLKNLTVSNTSLSVSAGGGLLNITGILGFGNISNATLNTGDNIVLISKLAGTAMVADITNGGTRTGNTITGKVTVERYYPARRAWRLVTAPLAGAGSIFSTWQNGGVYPPTGKGTYVSGPGANPAINGMDVSPLNNTSLKIGSLLTPITNTLTTNLSNATSVLGTPANKGYFIFVRGDRDYNNTNIANSNITTLSSKGNLQTGDQQFNLLGTDPEFSLIGNPYASPVDFVKLYATNSGNNINNIFYAWDPYLNTQQGGYITVQYSIALGTYDIIPASPGGQTTIIQSSQAFFVRKSNPVSPAIIKFTEPQKSTDSKAGLFRPMNKAVSLRTTLYLRNSNGTATLVDGNLNRFDNSFNAGIDGQDALKFGNVYETFGILSGNTSLSINYRPLLSAKDTIFYKFTRARQLKYQFEFIADNIEQENLAGFVEDKFLNKATPLNMNSTTKLDFEVTADAASAAADRFKIVFKPSVVYTSLTATVVKSDIAVEWNVPNELNIKEYDIERSVNGVGFTKVATRASSGNSATAVGYNWLDVSPALGYYYYRIRSRSNNNITGYSNVVKVKINRSTPAMYVFPNPVTENTIHLQMNSMPKGVYAIRLVNNLGQVIGTNWIGHLQGTATETIQPNNKLLTGIYQLEVTTPDKKTSIIKVIVK